MAEKAKLKITPLGGLDEIGKNMTVLEYGKDMIVIDCGLGFPEDDMYGIDLVVPDFTYISQNKNRLRGVFLTHGHEDHIGALPYFLKEIPTVVHGTALTLGLVQLKLEEHEFEKEPKLITHSAGDFVKAGCFTVEFIHVNHSIADSVAFAIHTPVGTVVFSGDYKIDPTDPEGMADLTRFGELGREGVLAYLGESTNVERPGHSPSETLVAEGLSRQFKDCKERIIVTTFASNMHRLQTLFDTAHHYGRKLAVTGRSMENVLKVCTDLGYLKIPPNTLVDITEIKKLPKDKVCIVCTGSQGEDMSAMYRIAYSMHRQVELMPKDRVIISASAIPGNEKAVTKIINELYRKGADVVYDKSLDLHASGHACREEIKIMHALLKPRFFIPIHGEQKHLRTHAHLAESMGMKPRDVFVLDIGQQLELTGKTCKQGAIVPCGIVLVDGAGVGDVGSTVLRDRKHMAEDGMLVVIVNVSSEDGSIISGPDIVTRGFMYVKENSELLDELRTVAAFALDRAGKRRMRDFTALKNAMKKDISEYVYKKTRRNPMILPVIMEI